MKNAESLEEFTAVLPRRPIAFDEGAGIGGEEPFCEGTECNKVFFGSAKNVKGQKFLPQFDADAARLLNTRTPTSVLVSLANSEDLAANLRQRLALAAWARAAILDDTKAAMAGADAAAALNLA